MKTGNLRGPPYRWTNSTDANPQQTLRTFDIIGVVMANVYRPNSRWEPRLAVVMRMRLVLTKPTEQPADEHAA